MALIDKTFALSDQWRDYLSKTFTKQVEDRIDNAILGGVSMSLSDSALSNLREKIRAAGPRCQPCGRLVDGFIVREIPESLNYHIEFRCHGEQRTQAISRETLLDLKSPADFKSLFGHDIFRRKMASGVVAGEPPSLKSINDYLRTRTDILPTCRRCDKKIDKIEIAYGTLVHETKIRFWCHNTYTSESVPHATVTNQDKMYDYLETLGDKKVSQPLIHPITADYTWISSALSSSSPLSIGGYAASFGDGQPIKRTDLKPKTPPKLAPILSATRVKRAVTFED